MTDVVIVGYGDVGQRIARLLDRQQTAETILAVSRNASADSSIAGLKPLSLDLDRPESLPEAFNQAELYYLAPPQKQGTHDLRSRNFISALSDQQLMPARVVLISTTGVYGDCQGEWVTEESVPSPQTDRGKRRLDSEKQWQRWCRDSGVALNILRVPGIYANSRLPRQRLEKAIPVVRSVECGYTNRIHADDLAMVAIAAMDSEASGEVFNVTDGTPGKISEYLQEAASYLGLPPLPEIGMAEAQGVLSEGMLSYLSESRRISNRKMLKKLSVALSYPDFRIGLRH
ncbi:MAG: SDR family oxidoreductase [Pseudomonadota bacterium]